MIPNFSKPQKIFKNHNLKIALDFDNVLADTTGAWISYYNKKYNKNIKTEQ